MRICFMLPHPAKGPTGGYKVVYEYANRFVADGYDVDIVYSGSIFWKQKPLRYKLSNCIRYIQQLHKGYTCRTWFDLDCRVKEHFTFSMNQRHVPKADVYVATSPYTAWYLNDYNISSKRKFYLIQDYENWGPGLKNILANTYHMPLTKIVISRWLKNLLYNEYGENSILIPNGFDLNKFNLSINYTDKNKYCVSLLYHEMDRKRCCDAIDALRIVKDKYPQLTVTAFGVPSRPKSMPDWFKYYRMPDEITHNRINNEAAIYVGSSESEGWGLTVGEAMLCGQAVCCTDNNGYKEMAIHEKTAFLSPIKNPEALADNIIRLIEDDKLRIRIAKEGNRYIQQFRWEDSYLKFKSLINNAFSYV